MPDWVILTIACVAQFMVVLDVSIVNVALPSIGRNLHYSSTGLQWVLNAYALTFAGFLLLGGRAADLFGQKRVYLAGLSLFTLASLAGGLAQSSGWLTAARAAQGLGGAILSPATLTIIVTTFSGPRLNKAIGAWSAVAGAGGAVGSLLGGVFTGELSWRWVLFVNIPIGVAGIAAAAVYLPEVRRAAAAGLTARRLDVAGAVTVTGGLGSLVYAIVGTDTHPWGSAHTLLFLGIAAVLLLSFVLIEARFAASPLVPFRLFRSRAVTGANMVMLLVGLSFFSFWYFVSLYVQNVLGYGALKAGFAFIPMAVSVIIGAQTSSRLIGRVGSRPVIQAGTLAAAAGFLWLSTIPVHSDYWLHIFGPGCIVSLGIGLLFAPLAAVGTSGVHYSEAGLASGVLNTSRQVGGSIGLAALATIAIDRTQSALHGSAAVSARAALTDGYSRAFLVSAAISVVALLASFVVPDIRRSATDTSATAGTAGEGGRQPAASVVDAEGGALPTLDLA